jgi:hypothetical protein
MVNLLVSILLALISVMSVVYEILFFKERARRLDAEMQLKLNDLLWQEACKKLNKTIDELEERIVDYKDRDEGRQNDGKNV